MDQHRHHVSGFYAYRSEAEITLAKLVARGLPRGQLQIFDTNSVTPPPPPPSVPAPEAGSDAVLKDILVDGTIGTAIGTGVGALAEVALVAANVSLFIASPLVAPLVMMGWGASIGALIGAATGAVKEPATDAGVGIPGKPEKKEGWLGTMIGDAITSGQFVLVVQTNTEQETAIAREIIQDSVGDYQDSNIV